MIYRTCVPAPPLDDFVAFLWLYENDAPAHAMEHRLPTGTMGLVINLREDALPVYDRQDPDQCRRLPGALINGPHTEHILIDTACQASTIGVHFRPGGAFPFLGMPASELCNAHVSLDTLWDREVGALRERLAVAPTPDAKFRLLEAALRTRIARPPARHPAVAFALNAFQNSGATAVSDVTAHIGLSHRHFIQLFRDEVGLTPKLYGRIRRFQDALRHIGHARNVDWADIALACGYYDQAHFIRDFRAFSGVTPTTYLARRPVHRNHVPLEG